MINKGNYFKIEVEKIATNKLGEEQTCRFLTCDIMLSGKTGRPVIEPVVKCEGIPLTSESSHPGNTNNWPINHIARVLAIASNHQARSNARSKLRAWYQRGLTNLSTIKEWERVAERGKGSKQHEHCTTWMPMPWHPSYALHSLLRKTVRRANERINLLETAFGRKFLLKIAWRKPCAAIGTKLDMQ